MAPEERRSGQKDLVNQSDSLGESTTGCHTSAALLPYTSTGKGPRLKPRKHRVTEPLRQFPVVCSLVLTPPSTSILSSVTPTLQQIDLRGTLVAAHSQNVFKQLVCLKRVYTSNYKLCCPPMLPDRFMKDMCFSSQDELSSCHDLLRSDLYRVFL